MIALIWHHIYGNLQKQENDTQYKDTRCNLTRGYTLPAICNRVELDTLSELDTFFATARSWIPSLS
jgi:hypothetical protein